MKQPGVRSGSVHYYAPGGQTISAPLYNVGLYGYLWSSKPSSGVAYYLSFANSGVTPSNYNYGYTSGFSLRCLAS